MEAETAFVRADGTVELNPVAAVHTDLPGVVNPWNTEGDGALRLDKPFQNGLLLILRMAGQHRYKRLQNFFDRLMELPFQRIAARHFLVDLTYIIFGRSRSFC
ncbi:hypothetical protein D3C73_1001620 [compost metagenome]